MSLKLCSVLTGIAALAGSGVLSSAPGEVPGDPWCCRRHPNCCRADLHPQSSSHLGSPQTFGAVSLLRRWEMLL